MKNDQLLKSSVVYDEIFVIYMLTKITFCKNTKHLNGH